MLVYYVCMVVKLEICTHYVGTFVCELMLCSWLVVKLGNNGQDFEKWKRRWVSLLLALLICFNCNNSVSCRFDHG
ncbi:hypothetical protein LguiA_030793 [Lonicera macranthoides]